MSRANDCEVSTIQCRDCTDPKALREGYDRGIDGPERKVTVATHELRDTNPVSGDDRLRDQISGSEIAEKSYFGRPAKACLDEVSHFGNDELRHQQRPWVRFEEPQALCVIIVVFIDVGVERSGVDDQRDLRVSSRMISSMRRAVSREPLLPAFAARSFRRVRLPR